MEGRASIFLTEPLLFGETPSLFLKRSPYPMVCLSRPEGVYSEVIFEIANVLGSFIVCLLGLLVFDTGLGSSLMTSREEFSIFMATYLLGAFFFSLF